jgi:hypothetical protein
VHHEQPAFVFSHAHFLPHLSLQSLHVFAVLFL